MYSIKFYDAIRFLTNKPFNLIFKPIVLYKNIVPKDEPLLFVGNHFSYLDPFMLGLALPERRIRFVGKEELFLKYREVINKRKINYITNDNLENLFKMLLSYPEAMSREVLSFILSKGGAFPINRDNNDVLAVRKTINLLKEGQDIAVYAEGTRNLMRDKKIILPFKQGIDGISILAKRRILPFAVSGDYKFKKEPIIKFGEPFKIEREDKTKYKLVYDNCVSTIDKEEATNYLEDTVKTLIIR